MQFFGKTALVTGGTAGIGRAIALAFAKKGASVAIFGTNEERAKDVVQEMESLKIDSQQRFNYFIVDVSHAKDVERCVNQLLSDWGRVDILVNNAGITRDNLLVRMTEEDWDIVVDVNLKSVYNTCRALARSMMKERSRKDHQYYLRRRIDGQCRAGELFRFESRNDRLYEIAGERVGQPKYLRKLCGARIYSNTDDPRTFGFKSKSRSFPRFRFLEWGSPMMWPMRFFFWRAIRPTILRARCSLSMAEWSCKFFFKY